jgi:hypothetical protein
LYCSICGVAPLPPGFTADNSIPGSHATSDVSGEDSVVLAVDAGVLWLGQDFLEQVQKVCCSTALSLTEVMFNLLLWSEFVPLRVVGLSKAWFYGCMSVICGF